MRQPPLDSLSSSARSICSSSGDCFGAGGGFFSGIEKGIKLVILFLAHRIVLVIVALGAAHRQPKPNGPGGVGPVHGAFDAELFRARAAFFIERGVPLKAGGDELLARRLRE